MKKRDVVVFILTILIITNIFMVFAVTITFGSRNNPFSVSGHTCTGKPILIDNDLTNVKNLQIGNIAGNLCNMAGNGICSSDLAKGCKSSHLLECGNGTIDILNVNNKLIKTYDLLQVKNGIALPPGAKSAYVYYKESKYSDNNGAQKCTFDYVKCNPSCAGKQCGDNGCGVPCTNTCMGTATPKCFNTNCVACLTYSDCPRPLMQDCDANHLCVDRVLQRCFERNNCTNPILQDCINGVCATLRVNTTCKDKDNNLNSNYTIMKLYNSNNSHVSTWDDVNYFEDICYGDLFNDIQEYDESSHECDESKSNLLFWMNGTRNSHGSTTEDTTYNTPLCFGNLVCRTVVDGTCNNAENEKAVVKLSNNTNAHVARGDSTIAYPITVCCKKSSISGDVSWQNLAGDDIENADLGDSVKLVLNRDELLNRKVDYNIYKKDGNTFLWFFKSDKQVAQLSSTGFTTWKTSEEGEFYFNASVEGYFQNYSSNVLTVSTEESNTAPQITIVKPVENSTFIIKANGLTNDIPFEQESYDDDDLLDIYWNFNDGNTTRFSDCNNGIKNCNATHRYSTAFAGTRIINATAKESIRKGSEYDLSRIYVYKEGLVLFVIIDSPDYKTRSFPKGDILLNATSSHVVNCSISSEICRASAAGKTCSEITDGVNPADKLYCYVYAPSSSNKFKFRWIVDGTTNPEYDYPTNASPFKKPFPQGGKHDIGLEISVNISKK